MRQRSPFTPTVAETQMQPLQQQGQQMMATMQPMAQPQQPQFGLGQQQRRLIEAMRAAAQPQRPTIADVGSGIMQAYAGGGGATELQQALQQRTGARQQQLATQVQAEQNIYQMMKDAVAQGDKDAIAVDEAIRRHAGDDPELYTQLAIAVDEDPEQANITNANRIVARVAASRGIRRPLTEKEKLKQRTAAEKNLISAGFVPGTPAYQKVMLESILKPETQIAIGDKATAAGMKKFAQLAGERASKRIDQAFSAQQQNAQLDRIGLAIARGAKTGKGEEFVLDLRNLGNTFFNLEMPESASEQEVVRKISNEMALRLRNPESGLGLTGNTSNKDLLFLQNSVIGLARSEQGNMKLIDLMKRFNDLAVAVSEEQQRIIQLSLVSNQGQEGLPLLDLDSRLMKFVNEYKFLTEGERAEIEALNKQVAAPTKQKAKQEIPANIPPEVMQEWDFLTPDERKLWQ